MAAFHCPPRLLRATRCCPTPSIAFRQSHLSRTLRFYSTASQDDGAPPPPAPYLATLKGELKTAMRAKDAPRLAVLRSIMSHNLNASKTKQPIRTNVELVNAIARMRRSAEESAEEARKVGRDDLVDKSLEEARLLQEYQNASGVEMIEGEQLTALIKQELEAAVKEAGEQSKTLMADTIKRVKELTMGKMVDSKSLASLTKDLINERRNA